PDKNLSGFPQRVLPLLLILVTHPGCFELSALLTDLARQSQLQRSYTGNGEPKESSGSNFLHVTWKERLKKHSELGTENTTVVRNDFHRHLHGPIGRVIPAILFLADTIVRFHRRRGVGFHWRRGGQVHAGFGIGIALRLYRNNLVALKRGRVGG